MTPRALAFVACLSFVGSAWLSAQAPSPAPAQTSAPAQAPAGRGGRGAPAPMPPPPPPGPADHTNTIGMEFMRIEPGRMIAGRYNPNPIARPAPRAGGPAAGSGAGRGGRAAWTWTDEQLAEANRLLAEATTPGFTVTIAKPYYIGRYEVTQGEWKRIMGRNPSVFQGDMVDDDADRHPVENVTWADAQAFIGRLNALEKTTAYRLPTEFEWEWASRAGAEDAPPTPGEGTNKAVMYRQGGTTARVGTMHPNAWGLYDTLGNVWEWVHDFYNDKVMPDAVPPSTGTQHVLKGGGFLSHVANIVSTVHAGGPGDGFSNGFRVVKDVQ